MADKKWQVVFSGAGGQGLILAGTVLGEAAAIQENLHAVQTQSYGVESRGGFSKAEVLISDSEIAYPNVVDPDIILALTQEAFDRVKILLADETILLYDSNLVTADSDSKKVKGFPFTELARDLGSTAAVNMVALGAMVGLTQMIKPDSIRIVLQQKYPKYPINVDAFNKGIELVE